MTGKRYYLVQFKRVSVKVKDKKTTWVRYLVPGTLAEWLGVWNPAHIETDRSPHPDMVL